MLWSRAGGRGPNAYLQYSLYVRPTMIGDLKCVILDSRLRDIEPMAFDFVLNFAKDNDLLVTEACELATRARYAAREKARAVRDAVGSAKVKTRGSGFFYG